MSLFHLAKLGLCQKAIGTIAAPCVSVSTPFLNLDSCMPGLILGGIRFKFSKKVNPKVQAQIPGGIQYDGFTYFPRFPDQKDPPIEPSKLFMVKRIRSLYGCPRWEKKWMMQLNLLDRSAVAIVKNTPSNNRKLYRVKHLVEITPITTPQGLPDKPENGFLKENGEFVCHNALGTHGDLTPEEALKGVAEYNTKNLDSNVLRKRMKARWYSRFDIV